MTTSDTFDLLQWYFDTERLMYFVCICISGSVGAFVDDRVVICGGYTMQDQEYLAGCQKQTGRKENGELEVRRHWLKSCKK